jgi:hypothetical protein
MVLSRKHASIILKECAMFSAITSILFTSATQKTTQLEKLTYRNERYSPLSEQEKKAVTKKETSHQRSRS